MMLQNFIHQLDVSIELIVLQTKYHLSILGVILLSIWIPFLITTFLDKRLLYFGIIPRRLEGLLGIFFAPFLHANFNHIFFNSIPLVVLSNFILISGLGLFLWVSFFITIISGLLIWMLARQGLYIGASAVITGFWGFLICDIWKMGTLTAIILGLTSLYYFAGIFLGVFPGKKGVSWEGHLFGLIAGIITSTYILGVYLPSFL